MPQELFHVPSERGEGHTDELSYAEVYCKGKRFDFKRKDTTKMNNTYTIKDLIDLLLSRIWIIIIAMILGGAAAFGVSKFLLPLEYSSHISMYVQSYTGISENNNNVNNISNSKQLVNTYMEVLKDDAVMNAVGDKLVTQFDDSTLSESFSLSDGKISPTSIRNCLSISSVTDTSAVKVVATAKDPEVAAAICNDLTSVAPAYVEEAVGVGSINTIDTAKIYNSPVAPNTKKNTALGIAAALMLTVMIIFVIDYFDNTVKEPDAVGSRFSKPIIGTIEQYGDTKKKSRKKSDQDSRMLLSDAKMPFNVSESYRSIRTNLLFALGTSEKKIVAISSPNPSEGKSTTAANIAIALAQTDSKVLLIDADMRKPVQHKTFKCKNAEGLSTLIIKKSTPAKSVKTNVVKGLDLLPSGPTPPNPSELLASEQFSQLLDQFAENYDYIIIDTPPVNVVSDAMVMKDCINGILLILRYGLTTNEEISNCMKQIELADTNMLGFVLNEVSNKRRSPYYKSKYGYKYKEYGYGQQPADKKNEEVKND